MKKWFYDKAYRWNREAREDVEARDVPWWQRVLEGLVIAGLLVILFYLVVVGP